MCCRVRQFLCGCTLRHGAITACVLGGINAVCSLLIGIIILVFKDTFLQQMKQAKQEHDQSMKDLSFDDSKFSDNRARMDEQFENATETMNLVLTIVGVICVVVGLVAGLITIFLAMSICLNNACLVIPWLIGAMIEIVINGILVIVGFFLQFMISIGALLWIAFRIYLWIILYNFHMDLKWNSGRGGAYVSAPTKA